jgi:hypothetical protein
MSAMFSEADLNQQQRLKCAFDDKGLLNPGKVFPTLHRCAELGRMHVHAGRVGFPIFRDLNEYESYCSPALRMPSRNFAIGPGV